MYIVYTRIRVFITVFTFDSHTYNVRLHVKLLKDFDLLVMA